MQEIPEEADRTADAAAVINERSIYACTIMRRSDGATGVGEWGQKCYSYRRIFSEWR